MQFTSLVALFAGAAVVAATPNPAAVHQMMPRQIVSNTTSVTGSATIQPISTGRSSTLTGGASVRPVNSSSIAAIPTVTTTSRVTVIAPELRITVIVGITIVVNLYNAPIVTVISGTPYTIRPAAQTTSTVVNNGRTTVIIGPAVTTAPKPVTTVVTVGTKATTVTYTPVVGPTYTVSGTAKPAAAAVGSFTYAATSSICTCPLAVVSTVTVISVPTSSTLRPATTSTVRPASTTSTVRPVTPAPAVATTNYQCPTTTGRAATGTVFPGLIIPVQSANPRTAYGTQYTANITPAQQVVFQYNPTKTGKCRAVIALPPLAQLKTSSYSIGGPGTFAIDKLAAAAAVNTGLTYATLPAQGVKTNFTAVAGQTNAITDYDCVAGQPISFVVNAVGSSTLSFFEDYNCPYVGLVLVQL